ncbi:MAG: HlyC/CorC family transporter [Phycisphaerales bacterium]|nr:MAG: HlyC/CorC family transporter [Phycisphaerales bacterium]
MMLAQGSADSASGIGLLGWEAIHIPMLIALPVLLLLSGFFSGSETALFGMAESERMRLRRSGTFAGRAVDALLSEPRMLLISVLLGNMTINVLYFVISSVLLMQAKAGVIGNTVLAIASLMLIILIGEVGPKLLANSRRQAFAAITAPPLLGLHRVIGPLRIVLNGLVVEPLNRLTAPSEAPPQLSQEELDTLLDVSGREGAIDAHEQRILQEVLDWGKLKVRDVMTPRVHIQAAEVNAANEEVMRLAEETRLTKFPVYEEDIDHIVGLLHVKRYLLDAPGSEAPLRNHISPVRFVPEIATLDQLLDHFRSTKSQLAIAVDEFGGTAGLVTIEDVVEEIVGDIVSEGERTIEPPRMIGMGRWRVSGDVSVHDWAEAFGQKLVSPRVATLGGLIIQRLGRLPVTGDAIELGNVRIEVETVDCNRVVSAIVILLPQDASAEAGNTPGGRS